MAATVAAPLLLWGQDLDELPYIGVKEDASGKYGYYDNGGRCVIPCIYDFAYSFARGKCVSAVKKGDLYYVIDRTGRMVMESGYDSLPDIFDAVAIVGDKGNRFIIDFAGRRLSPEGWNITPLNNMHNRDVPVLLTMNRVGEDDKAYLTDWGFEPLSNVPAFKFFFNNAADYAVCYYVKRGMFDNYGLMNADGDVIFPVPEGFGRITVYKLSSAGVCSDLEKAGVLSGYSDSDKANTFLVSVMASSKEDYLFALTGEKLAQESGRKDFSRIVMRNLDRTVGPYLRNRAANMERYRAMYVKPYERRCAVVYGSELYRGAVAAADSMARAVLGDGGDDVEVGDVEEYRDEDDVEEDGDVDWSGDFIAGFIDALGDSDGGSGQEKGADVQSGQKKEGKLPKMGTIIDSFNAIYMRLGQKIIVSTAIVDERPYLFVNDGYPAFLSDGTVGKQGNYFVFRSKLDTSETVLVSLDWQVVVFDGEKYGFPRVIEGREM